MKDVSGVSMPEPPKPGKDPSIVSLPKAARILNEKGIDISYGQLLRLVKAGKLPSYRNGIRYYVSIDVLLWYFSDPSSPLWDIIKTLPQ
jgi:hypothetical protein